MFKRTSQLLHNHVGCRASATVFYVLRILPRWVVQLNNGGALVFESLAALSNQEVRAGGQTAVANERQSTLAVLSYLIETEKRKLYLEDGHSSLFDFCTTAWGYSSSAAWRRIQTARCIMRFPCVLELLEQDEVNLSTMAQASRVLNETNCDDILARIAGKSQREVDSILSEFREEPLPRERVRIIALHAPAVAAPSAGEPQSALSFGGTRPQAAAGTPMEPAPAGLSSAGRDPVTGSPDCENSDYCRSGSKNDAAQESIVNSTLPDTAVFPERGDSDFNRPTTENETSRESASDIQPKRVDKWVSLHVSAPAEFVQKIERLRSLVWHRLPRNSSLTSVLELALDIAIAAKDPVARHERRKAKRQGHQITPAERPRYVPVAVRDEVFNRDGQQCTYVSPEGRRCTSTSGLQVDHINPIARGGTSAAGNLRLLCAEHNRLEAERLMGSTYAHPHP